MKDKISIQSNSTDLDLPVNGQVFDISLSTMWVKDNYLSLVDFFLAARKLGFNKVELNHQIDSEMLCTVDLGNYEISSIHEPCPADIPVETLKKRNWMISSPDEDCRQHGVAAVKRSIELAGKLSIHPVVVHCGYVSLDMIPENKLRSLFEEGLRVSDQFEEEKSCMVETRLKSIEPSLEAVEKSLKELISFASLFGVRLGLENRYHYFDIPTQDEMARLLELGNPDSLGFIYDTGHAMAMDRLGFFSNEMWLKRFAGRMLGTHLHDVIGISDHRAPGMGEVDFRMVAGYIPKDAFRTLEVMNIITPEQVKTGLKNLVDTGCISLI
jgi:sugar phosphate isomerase/epimerase